MSLRGRAAIVGVGELAPVRYTAGETQLGILARAGLRAAEDAGIALPEIDGLLVHPFGDVSMLAPSTVIEFLGMRVRFAELVDLGGASGAGMVWRAAAAIEAGLCHTCLCLTGSRRERPRPPPEDASGAVGPRGGRNFGMRDRSPYAEFEVPYGAVGANFGYAMIANRYAYEYGLTPEHRAKIAVDQRINACANPDAIFYDQPITLDDVLGSPRVVDPLHLLEIVMPVGGAAALVVTSAERARRAPRAPVWLLGAGEACTHKSITHAPSLTDTAIRAAADQAFEMAGVERSQVGLASLYDCYTITVLLTLEDAGFCEKGAGGPFAWEHDLTYAGDLPVNTHGGQLSFGQAGIAGGMSHVTEAARQLRGEAGARQIPGLELAFVNGNGGIMSEQVSLLLGVEP